MTTLRDPPDKAMAMLTTLVEERDCLCLKYIKRYAVGRYEPMLIDVLTRDYERILC